MRLSCIVGDPGYDAHRSLHALILVDNLVLDNCHTADEELGVALVYAKDRDGMLFPDPRNPGEAMEMAIYGRVQIRLLAEPDPDAGLYEHPCEPRPDARLRAE